MPVPRVGGTRLVAPVAGLFGATAPAEGAQQDQSRPSIFGAASSDNSISQPRFGTATSGGLFGFSTVVSSTAEGGGGQSDPAQSQPRSCLFGSVSHNSSSGQEETQSRIRHTVTVFFQSDIKLK